MELPEDPASASAAHSRCLPEEEEEEEGAVGQAGSGRGGQAGWAEADGGG